MVLVYISIRIRFEDQTSDNMCTDRKNNTKENKEDLRLLKRDCGN